VLEPGVAYEHYTVKNTNDSQTSPEGDEAIHGPLLWVLFPEAKELVVILGTIGPKLGKQVTDYSRNGATLPGVTLDGIGSAAVDTLVSEVLRLIVAKVLSRGYEISGPVNPNMPGFPPYRAVESVGTGQRR
jgi:hypothetical protein